MRTSLVVLLFCGGTQFVSAKKNKKHAPTPSPTTALDKLLHDGADVAGDAAEWTANTWRGTDHDVHVFANFTGHAYKRCSHQYDGDWDSMEPRCYMLLVAYAFGIIGFLIVALANCCKYCGGGGGAAPDPEKGDSAPAEGGKRKPVACLLGTAAGTLGLVLVPVGVVLYLLFLPFSMCLKTDDEHKGQQGLAKMCKGLKSLAKWLMEAPMKLGRFLADHCPC